MQVRVITLRYAEGLQGFSEEALRKATFGREVLSVESHFFTHGNVPHVALVLTLGDGVAEGSYRPRDSNAPDPGDQLPEERKPVYRDLKRWRNETAKAEGRPAYAIARNTQLAELAIKAPKTKAGIKEIEGFGEAFVERYGDVVLGLLAQIAEVSEGATPKFKDDTVDSEHTIPRLTTEGVLPL